MIVAHISQIGSAGSVAYLQIQVTKGYDNTAAEAYVSYASSIATKHAVIADACRQALSAAGVAVEVDEPIHLFGAAVEVV